MNSGDKRIPDPIPIEKEAARQHATAVREMLEFKPISGIASDELIRTGRNNRTRRIAASWCSISPSAPS
jgi:hypothetical protein